MNHVRFLLSCLLGVALASSARAQAPPTVIVVDSSGSMSAALAGATRLDAARGVLGRILASWPGEAPIGLVAYGHRRVNDCNDIEVLSPIGPPDAAHLTKRLGALLARGKTPLAASLEQATGLLKERGHGGTIILVTDGIETCHPDPCAVALALKAANAALSIHVIGFTVEAKDEKQLACIATAGGGLYRTAADAGSLLAGLDTAARGATRAAPPPAEQAPRPPMQATPEPVKTGQVSFVPVVKDEGPLVDHAVAWRIAGKDGGQPFRYEGSGTTLELAVPAGRYSVEAIAGNVVGRLDVSLAGEPTQVEVPLAAGRLKARAVAYKGAEPLDERAGLTWSLTPLDGQAPVAVPLVAQPAWLVAAGRYRLAVEHQGRRAETEATVASGSPLDLELSLRLGEIQLSAAPSDNGEPVAEWRGLSWRALTPDGKTAAEATQQAAPVFVLPSGRYRIELAAVGVTFARDVDVLEGEREQVRLLLPTGSRTLSAALAPGLEPLTDWRDTSWTVTAIETIGMAAGTTLLADQPVADPTLALEPGRWRVAVKSGLATAEREILVTPQTEDTVRLDLGAARLQIEAAPEAGASSPINIVFEIFPLAADGTSGPAALTTGTSRAAGSLLPAGRWRIIAVDDQNRRAEQTIELGAGEDKSLDLTLK